MKNNKKIIPIFYASDENYLPYVAVSLHSLKAWASSDYEYRIYILHAGMDEACENARKLKKYACDNLSVTFVDVSVLLEDVRNALQLRDYYTGATYYRIFIPNMFPQYDKALYLDGDTVLQGDVSELFNVELGTDLVGAIPDGAVAAVPEFRLYTKEALGISYDKYFNAGVLLMNLKACRESDFYSRFCFLLSSYKFSVAQDQDYLNVLCKGRVRFIGGEWNAMPIKGKAQTPKLIHYNLTLKPWHYEDILYHEAFWAVAKQTEFFKLILDELSAYTQEKKERDAASEKALLALCAQEAEKADNYYKKFGEKEENEGGRYGYNENFSRKTANFTTHRGV